MFSKDIRGGFEQQAFSISSTTSLNLRYIFSWVSLYVSKSKTVKYCYNQVLGTDFLYENIFYMPLYIYYGFNKLLILTLVSEKATKDFMIAFRYNLKYGPEVIHISPPSAQLNRKIDIISQATFYFFLALQSSKKTNSWAWKTFYKPGASYLDSFVSKNIFLS